MRSQESLLPERSIGKLTAEKSIKPPGQIRLTQPIRAKWLIRAAAHLACWIPFITSAADSWRGPWRVVGDGAQIAVQSWATLSVRIPLLGQPNELPHGPHDLGPMEYWLLAVPVHIDPARGVLWGAALLALLAASLTVEAARSALGEAGGLLASGVVIAMVMWLPGLAIRPYWNPYFGVMFFITALAACLAVLSGGRKYWPVLVVSASIAAQAHLMFAPAAVGLVLMGLAVGLADEFRARTGYSWLFAGLVAGITCWMGPLDQQFTSPMGNMSVLLHAENAGRHAGFGFAMKAMASLAVPSPLWWQPNIIQRHDLYRLLDAGPQFFGLMILVITAASLVIAGRWLRSRQLAGLAAISLLISATAATTFALIPASTRDLGRLSYLVIIMFVAVLLGWLTAISAIAGVAARLTAVRRRVPGPVHAAAAALAVVVVLPGAVRQAAGYAGEETNSRQVSSAIPRIERSVPTPSAIALSVSARRRADRYRVLGGLVWALTADGYAPDIRPGGRDRPIPRVTVVLRGGRMTILVFPRRKL